MADNFFKFILSIRDYYGKYHDHKENMAWLATVAFFTGFYFLTHEKSPLITIKNQLVVFLIFLISYIWGNFLIIWQLRNRVFGNLVVKACRKMQLIYFTQTMLRLKTLNQNHTKVHIGLSY